MRRRLPIVLLACGSIAACGGDDASEDQTDRALAAARHAFEQAQARGVDLEAGPCIAERLPGLEDWVADVAHDPREDIDDEAENQCRRYRSGEASHFVELTPDGELIRAE
jgi:hypothetical protein